MADLKVDFAVLESSQSALKSLADQLRRSEQCRDEMVGRWGGKHVERAMRGFVDDWDRHRKKLVEALDHASAACGATLDTFCGIEAALSDITAGRGADGPVGRPG